jgi:hypothetical protein
METCSFPSELEKSLKGQVGELDRWLSSFRELQAEMAARLVFLARYHEEIPSELTSKYVEALVTTFESLPDDCTINTSTVLREKLYDFVQNIEKEADKKRVQQLLERHLVAS